MMKLKETVRILLIINKEISESKENLKKNKNKLSFKKIYLLN